MKKIGKNFGDIGKSFKDATQNQANAARAEELAVLFTEALEKTPDSIAKLPAAQRPVAIAQYKRQIGEMITTSQQLQQAFVAGDAATSFSLC